jgi:hypothetical protein
MLVWGKAATSKSSDSTQVAYWICFDLGQVQVQLVFDVEFKFIFRFSLLSCLTLAKLLTQVSTFDSNVMIFLTQVLVFEAHPSNTQIRCTICDQETGICKWISRTSSRHHIDSQQHRNALNNVQQRLTAQQTTAAETGSTFRLKTLDSNTLSQSESHHEARM